MAAKVETKSITTKSSSRMNEVVALGLLVVAVLIFLCLISHNPSDWSLNTSSSQKIQNWIGVLGSVVSDLLFQTVGLTAYVLPAMLGLIAWRIFRSETLYAPLSRIIGFSLFILSIAGLLTIFLSSGFRGGIVGALLAQTLLINLIGRVGTIILLSAAFLTAVLLITNLSYLLVFDNVRMAWENFRLHFDTWYGKFKQWRETQNAEALARSEKRRESRENETPPTKGTKKPTISLGDKTAPEPAVVSDEQIDKTSIFSGASSLLQSLKQRSNAEPQAETADLEPVEEPKPEISSGEKILYTTDEDPFDTLNKEVEPISIAPIKETGDLPNLEKETEKETDEDLISPPFPIKSEPQNFDDYVLPASEFLNPAQQRIEQKDEILLAVAQELMEKTKEFNATGTVKHISPGPVVTTYEFKPDPGVKYSRITGLADDLCLALKAESIRIDRIPGKAHVGIEVPNQDRETIFLREVIESKKFQTSESKLTVALGKSIDGLNYVADLAKMPHLLIAGATGAGKSVGVNTLIVSILYKARPDEVKFIMVDPKQVELGIYGDIPHLATPIITDPKRAAISLKWAVSEMERRYKDLAGLSVRNLEGYNQEVKKRNQAEQYDDNGEPWKTLPFIVIIIDELADLMMVAGKEVEESITRLAQMARAVGIHLVLATQRPSVDVITGLIKANFPARISFRVSSKIDSRTIIDANGSERLLGRGDMLFLPPATSQIVRVHGAFVDEKEIAKIVDHIKAQGRPEYDTTITKTEDELDDSGDLPGRRDPLFMDALRTVIQNKGASTSLLQRYLRIGYGRAAAILDAMVREGFIGEMEGSKRARPVLEKAHEYLEGYESAGDI
jgi:DNA segregation ATPase FtsK/SpoIIIE, S-DNA-T family